MIGAARIHLVSSQQLTPPSNDRSLLRLASSSLCLTASHLAPLLPLPLLLHPPLPSNHSTLPLVPSSSPLLFALLSTLPLISTVSLPPHPPSLPSHGEVHPQHSLLPHLQLRQPHHPRPAVALHALPLPPPPPRRRAIQAAARRAAREVRGTRLPPACWLRAKATLPDLLDGLTRASFHSYSSMPHGTQPACAVALLHREDSLRLTFAWLVAGPASSSGWVLCKLHSSAVPLPTL